MKEVFVVLSLLFLMSCSNETPQNNSQKQNVNKVLETNITTVNNNDLLIQEQAFENIQLPYTDSTNFDNYLKSKPLSDSEINNLQLNQIQDNLGYSDSVYYSKNVSLSTNFNTSLFLFLSENELKSVLVNYTLKGQLIDFIEVAYDEIAEGWSRKTSEIYSDKIIVKDILWLDKKQVKISHYVITNKGEIHLNLNKFKTDIRPNEFVKIDQKHIDTLVFIEYQDGGDYRSITVKNKNKNIKLVYNWDFNDTKPYSFKKGDTLKITWAIDTVFIAGEDERIDYEIWVIDAERFKS